MLFVVGVRSLTVKEDSIPQSVREPALTLGLRTLSFFFTILYFLIPT